MAYLFRTRDKSGKLHARWRFQYTDWQWRRRTETGYTSRIATEKRAAKIELEHDEIRRGYKPPPKSWNKHAKRPFGEVKKEYFEWGGSMGGRGGRPWSRTRAQMRRKMLGYWQKRLGLETLGDVEGMLPRVEEALRELQKAGLKGKPAGARSRKCRP